MKNLCKGVIPEDELERIQKEVKNFQKGKRHKKWKDKIKTEDPEKFEKSKKKTNRKYYNKKKVELKSERIKVCQVKKKNTGSFH